MTFTNIDNQIDTEDDFINCDRFLDIDFDFDLSIEELNLLKKEQI